MAVIIIFLRTDTRPIEARFLNEQIKFDYIDAQTTPDREEAEVVINHNKTTNMKDDAMRLDMRPIDGTQLQNGQSEQNRFCMMDNKSGMGTHVHTHAYLDHQL